MSSLLLPMLLLAHDAPDIIELGVYRETSPRLVLDTPGELVLVHWLASGYDWRVRVSATQTAWSFPRIGPAVDYFLCDSPIGAFSASAQVRGTLGGYEPAVALSWFPLEEVEMRFQLDLFSGRTSLSWSGPTLVDLALRGRERK